MSIRRDQTIKTLGDENARLQHSVEELSILNDLARLIGASSNSEDIMQTIVSRSLHALHTEQGVITMVDTSLGQSTIKLVRGMASSTQHPRYHLNQNLVGWMQLNNQPITINDPKSDARFSGAGWDKTIHNVLRVPMISKLTGVLTVYNLGVLHEKKGLKNKAIREYEKFLGLWKNADKSHPEPKGAKARLAALMSTSGG
jgi:hypothetical protein